METYNDNCAVKSNSQHWKKIVEKKFKHFSKIHLSSLKVALKLNNVSFDDPTNVQCSHIYLSSSKADGES